MKGCINQFLRFCFSFFFFRNECPPIFTRQTIPLNEVRSPSYPPFCTCSLMAPALSSVRSFLSLVLRLADVPELALPDAQLTLSVKEIFARWSQSRCQFSGTCVGEFTVIPSLAYLVQEVFAYSLSRHGFPRVFSRTLCLLGLARPVSRLPALSRFPKESYQPVWLLARR